MKCVKDVSCVDHLSSVNLVTNVPIVVPDLPVGARLHQFLEKWAALGASPKVVLREGFTLPFRFRPNSTRSHNCHKLLCKSPQEPLLAGGFASAGEQKCSRTGHNSKISGVLETYLGPQHLEQLSKHTLVQNGDTRDNKCLPTGS